ncbi:hypothetical protein Dimus_021202, partial [Dionaea muscipula]
SNHPQASNALRFSRANEAPRSGEQPASREQMEHGGLVSNVSFPSEQPTRAQWRASSLLPPRSPSTTASFTKHDGQPHGSAPASSPSFMAAGLPAVQQSPQRAVSSCGHRISSTRPADTTGTALRATTKVARPTDPCSPSPRTGQCYHLSITMHAIITDAALHAHDDEPPPNDTYDDLLLNPVANCPAQVRFSDIPPFLNLPE